jgi:hypothetical protein
MEAGGVRCGDANGAVSKTTKTTKTTKVKGG